MESETFLDRPLVVILGATGCGKTKLSVEICKNFNGEVISTDSMQVYEGLDVATNKVTREEAQGIQHHMISFLNPLTLGHTVVHFRNRAVKIIDELHAKNKLPVIVGGTNYYNEAILWKILLSDPDAKGFTQPIEFKDIMSHLPEEFFNLTNEQLHDELKKVDPVEAERVHPSTRRRVLRCLQHYYAVGRRMSDDLRKQREETGGSTLGGPLRYQNACVIWLQCDKEVLRQRLDSRVDEMVSKGLRDEVASFYDRYFDDYQNLLKNSNVDAANDESWTKGVFQCIGMKEFRRYATLTLTERSTDIGKEAFDEGVERLKLSTRQYANSQGKRITNRFLRENREAPPVYALNATNVDTWDDDVQRPALDLVEKFLNGEKPSSMTPLPRTSPNRTLDSQVNRTCDVCDRLINGNQWDVHLRSKFHKANVGRKNKQNFKYSEQITVRKRTLNDEETNEKNDLKCESLKN